MSRDFSDLVDRTDIERGARSIADPIKRLRYIRQAASEEGPGITRRWICLAIAAAALPLKSDAGRRKEFALSQRAAAPTPRQSEAPDIWPVEQNREYDLYSNGLRVENTLEVANEPRVYTPLRRDTLEPGPQRTQPAGIVFHTTESDLAPFEAGQKPRLKRIGREVLLYVRNKRAYHFVIDRFGRAHRIVSESDSANHAGHSIWADERWAYLDLNSSFIGVAFEGQSGAGEAPITPAQIRTARALAEMLRSRYRLAAENCVTHAQVSINPSNWRIGWHTDWAGRFPFRDAGLPDNYAIPNPSLCRFGFEYDPEYETLSGAEMRQSLAAADEQIRREAAARGLAVRQYRSLLQQDYRKAQASLRTRSAQEKDQ